MYDYIFPRNDIISYIHTIDYPQIRYPSPKVSSELHNKNKTTKGIDQLDSDQDQPCDNNNACGICLERKRLVVFDPCGHLNCCITCVKEMAQQKSNDQIECPECREKVKKVLRVYNS